MFWEALWFGAGSTCVTYRNHWVTCAHLPMAFWHFPGPNWCLKRLILDWTQETPPPLGLFQNSTGRKIPTFPWMKTPNLQCKTVNSKVFNGQKLGEMFPEKAQKDNGNEPWKKNLKGYQNSGTGNQKAKSVLGCLIKQKSPGIAAAAPPWGHPTSHGHVLWNSWHYTCQVYRAQIISGFHQCLILYKAGRIIN